MACTNCHREIRTPARGLCAACYQRWRKTGTTEYQRKGKRSVCQIDDCEDFVVSHGLCDMHRQRLRKHGSIEQTRPDSWGAKHKHPLYHSWDYLRRHRTRHPVDSVWLDDFLQFATDLGERPSRKHKLFSADESKPIGPNNFVWKTAITQRAVGEDMRTYMNRANKVYRAVRAEAFQGYELKRHYGMSKFEYDALSRKQDAKCAICGEAEGTVIRGRTISLAVDHCHSKGHVRGLLCKPCNQGIGHFKDSPAILRKAAQYLE